MTEHPVKLRVEIEAGDTGGLDALSEMEKSVLRTSEILDEAKKTGSLNGIAIDGAQVEELTLKFNVLAAQINIVGAELVQAATDLQALDKSSPDYDKQALKVAKLAQQYAKLSAEIRDIPDAAAKTQKLPETVAPVPDVVPEATGGGGNKLQRIGSNLRNLPSMQIPGLGIGTDAIGNILRMSGALSEATPKIAEAGLKLAEGGNTFAKVGAAVVPALTGISGGIGAIVGVAAAVILPVAALVGALAFLNHQSEESAKGTRLLIKEQAELFKLIATGTQSDVRAKLEDLTNQKKALEDQVAVQRNNLAKLNQEAGGVGAAIADVFNFGGVQEYRKNLQEAEKNLQEVNSQLGIYNGALNDSEVLARTVAKTLADNAEGYVKLQEAIKGGDFKGATDQIDEALRTRQAAEDKIAYLEKQKTERSAAEQAALQEQIDKIKTDELAPAVEQVNTLTSAVRALGYTSLEAAKAAEDANDIQARLAAIRQGIDLQKQINDLVVSGSSEQYTARKTQIDQEIAAINAALPEIEQLSKTSDDAKSALKDYQTQLDSLNREQSALTSDTLALIQAREAEAAAIQASLGSIDTRIQLETQAAELMRTASSDQIKTRLQGLDDEKKAIERQLPELSKLAETSDDAAKKLADYRKRIADINEETSTLKTDVAPAVRAREYQQAQDDIQKAETDSAKKILGIREDALKTLAKIEDKRSDSERQAYADRAKKLDQITQKANERLDSLNSEYMKSQREKLESFQKEEKRRIEDANDEKIRLTESLHASLLQAEEDNNVVAFIRAQREADAKLKTIETDADKERNRRYEDFMAEQTARATEHEEKLQAIQSQAQQERDAVQAAFNDKLVQIKSQADEETLQLRNTMAERIKAEQDALAERTAAIKQQYGLENSMIQERTKQRMDAIDQESQALTDAQTNLQNSFLDGQSNINKEELKRHQDLVKQKVDTERAAFQEFFRVVQTGFQGVFTGLSQALSQMAAQLMHQASQTQSQRSGGSGSGSSGGTGGSLSDRLRGNGVAYAEGGLITSPTIAFMGEKLKPGYAEAVINFKPSEGLPPDLFKGNSGPAFVMNGDVIVGNGMSPTEVKEMIYGGMKAAVSGIKKARYE